MMVIKKIGILTLLILLSLGTTAQTIVWQLKPTDYSGIERFGPDLYQVKKDGKIGLIRSDGSVVIPIGYTEMTGFYEHKALVLNDESDSDGNPRILGYLTDEGRYVQFSSSYFSLKGLAFYSDGMLPVNDAKGRRGYLDERGSSVLGFDGKWSSIMPFTEGHAVVFTGKKGDLKYHLIDKDGNYARFLLGNGIELYGGKNVYNGKAMVWDTNGKFYNYDVLTGKCSSSKQPANKQNDYLYCFIDITGRGKTAPYNTFPVGHKGLEPVAGGACMVLLKMARSSFRTSSLRLHLLKTDWLLSICKDNMAFSGMYGEVRTLPYLYPSRILFMMRVAVWTVPSN